MKFTRNSILSLAIGLVAFFTVTGVFSATLNVVSGQLYGASGVNVNGTSYDVAFKSGTCASVYGSCIQSSFAFNTPVDALAASQALSDQVFKDSIFQTHPGLINGIAYPDATSADILTIYSLGPPNILFVSGYFISNGGADQIIDTYLEDLDPFISSNITYAKWTISAVPLPTAFPLYGAGIAVMGFIGWRSKINWRPRQALL